MPSRYFKLLSLCEGREEWIISEFLQGRARYGWSPKGADLTLRLRGGRPWEDWPEDIRWAWGYSKFLVERIEVGHRIVMQTSLPLRSFLIGEVVAPGYEFDGSQEDFNHILHVRPLVATPIPVNAHAVSDALKHDLSKRGRYYEIYPERATENLDEIVGAYRDSRLDLNRTRKQSDTRDRAAGAVRSAICQVIRNTWPAQQFEHFCVELCESLPFVEVKEHVDRGCGWDMLVRFINPITNEVLLDGVPVQCKNYAGEVRTMLPLDDLERCVRSSDSSYAMLFILGELTDEFRQAVQERQQTLTSELGREIQFDVVDESRIAEIYATSLSRSLVEDGTVS